MSKKTPHCPGTFSPAVWNRLLQRIAFPLISTRIGRHRHLSLKNTSAGNLIELRPFCDHLPDSMLRCAVAQSLRRHRLPHNPQSLFVLSTKHWCGSDLDRGPWRQTQRQFFKKSLPIRV
jgi:hypothetical protein